MEPENKTKMLRTLLKARALLKIEIHLKIMVEKDEVMPCWILLLYHQAALSDVSILE
jgi:hypothetical protein